ncbi:MAG: hypothetical protein ACXIU7_03980 [Roseinatronobacter sp.]
MVDTRRLEKLMQGARAPDPQDARDMPPSRGALALSGHRDTRDNTRARGPSGPDLSHIEGRWNALEPCRPDPEFPRKTSAFTKLARRTEVMSRFDLLRTQLVTRFRDRLPVSLGLSAPSRDVGVSFTVAGLVASFARRGDLRVIALDLNPVHPALHTYFEFLPNETSILDLLQGNVGSGAALTRLTDKVALGLGRPVAPDYLSAGFSAKDVKATLAEITDRYAPDLLICDLPPMLDGDFALTAATNLDTMLLVAHGKRTRSEDMLACERLLAGQTEFLGVVLNSYTGTERI